MAALAPNLLARPSKFSAELPHTTLLGFYLLWAGAPCPFSPTTQAPPQLREDPVGFSTDDKFFQDLHCINATGMENLHTASPPSCPLGLSALKESRAWERKPFSFTAAFWTTLHPAPPPAGPGWWKPSHHLCGRQSGDPTGRQVQCSLRGPSVSPSLSPERLIPLSPVVKINHKYDQL